jgi:subtilisin family serine protease
VTRTPRLAGILAVALIAAGGVAGSAEAATKAAPAAQVITLITGDVVQLTPAGDGRYAATVRPAPGREGIGFSTVETAGGLRVVPADAVPMLADGRLDADLFDVERLVEHGYGDAVAPALPLIVQSAGTARALGRNAGVALPSIGAVAVRADKKTLAAFWSGRQLRTAGASKIWLDGKVTATLDRSTAQIGAPTAWQAGLDGRGVKVAVLDTGADPTHPDLAGKVELARDFSGSPDTVDHFGHGTHVAATVAGTGAASGGSRKGVAPGARLLIGKVLDDTGSGYESSIIEGMQWATDQGAKVVNMSLGGGPTDGTDPMAAAVDELSAATGTLFVVAAGNDGADSTVGTPGSAPSALTVGAVDRADALADFSSRGPRLTDDGLKPEITAPGVDIVAARAAGTSMGDPVDDLYTTASGTSMATPHVAGAAAIVAQQHPDWSGTQIKNELISTARTSADATVYGQGAGRVDVARAVTQQVSGTGVADFARHAVGETPARLTRTVTYTNRGTAPVSLSLRVTVRNLTRQSADADAITVSPASVVVPAGGRADVPVVFDLTRTDPGLLGGWLTATAPGGLLVTTALGGSLEGPHHQVTFRAVDRFGAPASVPTLQLFGDDARSDVLSFIGTGDTRTVDVVEGDYLLDAQIENGTQATLVTNPELRVDRDLTVVLDARHARPIRIETPQPAEQRTVLSYYAYRVTGSGRRIANGFMHFSTVKQVNVTPTAALRAGSFEFSSRWQLEAPMVRASVPGVAGPLDVNLLGSSAVYSGTRRFDLVAGLGGRVRGKAVVLDPPADGDEYAQARAAAKAGAAAVLIIRPAGQSAWTSWSPDGEDRLPIPSAVVAHDDGLRIRSGHRLSLTLTPSSPYLYDVMQVSSGRVPAQIVYRVTPANSQRITSRYADNGGLDWVREQRFGWRPWQEYAWNDAQRMVRTPSVREEWVSTGDTRWQHQVHHLFPWSDLGAALSGGIGDDETAYRPGRSAETWNAPVVRPATPAGYASTRTGGVLHLRIADYVDSTDRHHLVDPAGQALARLYRNGALVSETPDAWRDVPVPAGAGDYRLTLTTARGGPDWAYGTATDSEWTFRSAADGTLPLLQVSYSAPVSLTGTATARAHPLGITVPGAVRVTVATSADEGATWVTAPVVRHGSGWTALVPAGRGTVTLRVTAADRAGDTVRQTVVRAYGRS